MVIPFRELMNVTFVTNIPSPYRVTLFDRLGSILQDNFNVIYCCKEISNLSWEKPIRNHNYIELNQITLSFANRSISYFTGMWKSLRLTNPDIIVTGEFKVHVIIAILYSCLYRKKLIINTDAWQHTEKSYFWYHFLIRRIVYSIADAFMPVGIKGHKNFRSYGINEKKIFIVPYTIQEKKYYPKSFEKKYDLMFCGQLIDRKMPMFACRIAEEVKRKLGTVSLLILGKGPMEEEVRLFLEDRGINYEMPGFIQQDEIPVFYQKSRIFLFPSKSDGWGVVANEACAAGLPVLTCDQTGAANDLIQNNYNGFVLDLDEKIWVEKILLLLADSYKYNQFSTNSLVAINRFSTDVAAKNALRSFNYVMKRHGSEKK